MTTKKVDNRKSTTTDKRKHFLLELQPETHHKMKIAAAIKGLTMQSYIVELIETDAKNELLKLANQ